MKLLELSFSFVIIGMVGFGGGYSILKVMMHELVDVRGWISLDEFLDVVAISQSTPGPIALNAATFVGYKVEGVLGSVLATFAVVLVPFLLSYFLGNYMFRNRDKGLFSGMLLGLRPVALALVASAAYSFAPLILLSPFQAFIALVSLFLLFKFKLDPILLLLSCGLLGVVFRF
ncbi:MAG: chromate transporter [Synergistetes bacterium]|nr:MAG: Chromate transporter [bacterium 42_11]MBC7331253.1 chromate transporter [Synergistota bacterium]MDK2871553.1 chromate transporter [bacterium]